MTPRGVRILIADHNRFPDEDLVSLLNQKGYQVATANSGAAALDKLVEKEYALLLANLNLPQLDGLQLLAEIKKRAIPTETIIISGNGTVSGAVEAIKSGAFDFLIKPLDVNRLKTTIAGAIEKYETSVSPGGNKDFLHPIWYEDIIGQSKEMIEIYKLIDAVADTTANVVITGESGTGKELVACAIHKKSERCEGPFVAVNCSAFPKEILENELFGHEEGAFTGALKEKPGCFELADTGTLFLDEVCEMPMETQAKILRAIEERRFRRLGGKDEIEVDVRVISASNQKLEQAVEEKVLREDIYYRLSVVEIELPPLRERNGDVPLLIHDFLKMFSERNRKKVRQFSPEAMDVLNSYTWPGNVRELKNTIERAVVLCRGETVRVKELPQRIVHSDGEKVAVQIPVGTKLDMAEQKLICKTLQFVNNNKTRAAKILGISLKTLHNKLNQYKSKK